MSIVWILGASLLAPANSPILPLYQGRWTTDLARCGGEDVDAVVIGASTMTFYEARGTIRHSSRGVKGMSATVDFQGEGRAWTEGVRLHPLDRDRLELTALGRTTILQKCPVAASTKESSAA